MRPRREWGDMPLLSKFKMTPPAAPTGSGSLGERARVLALQTAGELNILTDADREEQRRHGQDSNRGFVVSRLLSWNGAISLLMLAGATWVARHPQLARQGWRSIAGWGRQDAPADADK